MAICAAAVIWAAVGPSRLAGVLAWRPLVALGLISWGVYLWHWPIFLWLQGPDASVLAQLTAVAVTVVVATASYVAVEAGAARALRPTARRRAMGHLRRDRRVGGPARSGTDPGSNRQRPADGRVAGGVDRRGRGASIEGARAAVAGMAPGRHVPMRILVNGDSSMLASACAFRTTGTQAGT